MQHLLAHLSRQRRPAFLFDRYILPLRIQDAGLAEISLPTLFDQGLYIQEIRAREQRRKRLAVEFGLGVFDPVEDPLPLLCRGKLGFL